MSSQAIVLSLEASERQTWASSQRVLCDGGEVEGDYKFVLPNKRGATAMRRFRTGAEGAACSMD